MSGLILKLRPHEELMINGVLVENGERNTRLRVKTERAHILRLRDALSPQEATTPVTRAYYTAQLAVAGQLPDSDAASIISELLLASPGSFRDHGLADYIINHDFYGVMRSLRDLALANRKTALSL